MENQNRSSNQKNNFTNHDGNDDDDDDVQQTKEPLVWFYTKNNNSVLHPKNIANQSVGCGGRFIVPTFTFSPPNQIATGNVLIVKVELEKALINMTTSDKYLIFNQIKTWSQTYNDYTCIDQLFILLQDKSTHFKGKEEEALNELLLIQHYNELACRPQNSNSSSTSPVRKKNSSNSSNNSSNNNKRKKKSSPIVHYSTERYNSGRLKELLQPIIGPREAHAIIKEEIHFQSLIYKSYSYKTLVSQADLEIAFAQLKGSNQISKKWLIPRLYPLYDTRKSQDYGTSRGRSILPADEEDYDVQAHYGESGWVFFRWLISLIPLLIEAYLFIFDRWRAWVTANIATPILSIISFYMARDLGGHIFNYQDNTIEVGKWIDEHVYNSSRENVFGCQSFEFCKEGSWYTYTVRNKSRNTDNVNFKATTTTITTTTTLTNEPFFSIQWYSMKRRLYMSPSNLLTYFVLLLGFALTFFLPLKGFINYIQDMFTTNYYIPGSALEFIFLFRGFLGFPLVSWILSKILSNIIVFVDQQSYQERVYNTCTYTVKRDDREMMIGNGDNDDDDYDDDDDDDDYDMEERRDQLIQQSEYYTLWITVCMGASFGFMLFLTPVWFVFGKLLQFIGYIVGSGRNSGVGKRKGSSVVVVPNSNNNNKTN